MSVDFPRIPRRQMLAGMGAGGLAVLLAACGASGQSASGNSSSSAGTPVRGGTLRGGINQDLIPANFYTNSDAGVTSIIGLVYESLIRYPNTNVVPAPLLATSWQLASNGLSLTLQLRKGVTFHTGRAFTSKDAAFSLQTYATPKWTPQLLSTAQAITGYDTSDPYTLVLHFAHPLTNIYDLLDTVPIVDSETFAGVGTGQRYVGTGPFKFVSWTQNTSLKFVRNENYWRPGLPYLDAVDLAVVPDASSLTSQLRSGQIDLDNGSSFLDVKELTASSGFSKIELTGAEDQIYVGTNLQHPALSDLQVRQAIAYALDRENILNEVFLNSGYVVNLPWPKYSPAYSAAKNATYAYNPDKAKALVQGYGKKIPSLPLTYSSPSPIYQPTAEIIQANLQAVGIPVELDPVDASTFVKDLIGGQLKGLWTTYHSWAQYIPSTLTVSAYPFNAAKNSSHYASAKYSADAKAAWEAPSPTSSAAVTAYQNLSDDLLDALFLIEIGVVLQQWAVASKVHGVSYTKRSELNLTEAWIS